MQRYGQLLVLGAMLSSAFLAVAQTDATARIYKDSCSGCHGAEATGGDRGPALANSRHLRSSSVNQIESRIRNGSPNGMPAFNFPAAQLTSLASWIHSLNAAAADAKPEGDVPAGERFFFEAGGCSECHMVRGHGGIRGPDLSSAGRRLTTREIEAWLLAPASQAGSRTAPGCPSWAYCPDESFKVVDVRLKSGEALRGFAKNRGRHDLQLQTFDGRLRMLTEPEILSVKEETGSPMPTLKASDADRRNLIAYLSSLDGIHPGPLPETAGALPRDGGSGMNAKPGEWPTYNGDPGGNRHSALELINPANARELQLRWTYALTNPGTEMTPLVVGGVMYVTAPGEVDALDARTGAPIWHYLRAKSGDPGSAESLREPNRGVAIWGDRVFYASGDAHLICLHRITGAVMWDVKMPDLPGPYTSTSAPLIAGGLVVSGIGGGDRPLRGFVDAYDPVTGKRVWRFWTIPKPDEKAAASWRGKAIATGGGATWVTGSYDRETETLYWTTGNPYPATDGDDRGGSNLYTNCVVALNAKTGTLRWFYQFTPHDLHDWDATEPVLLVDAMWRGQARKLLLQANRNGFFYVLDRVSGELLLAKPFVRRLNWASGIGADGKPMLLPANQPTRAGLEGCPAVRGATNWYATAYSPSAHLFFVMAVEDCSVYTQSHDGGYAGARNPSAPGRRFLRAVDIESGEIRWELAQPGSPEENYSGVLSTASGLLLYGETGGTFAAVDSATGKALWNFPANAAWKASPMTYVVDGRQYIAIAAGQNVLAFALSPLN